MTTIRRLEAITSLAEVPGPVVLAIGVFDGVHLGHQAVISRALADAEDLGGNVVVVTFHPHPARVLRPERAPHLLASTQHKEQLLASLGVRYLLIIPFDADFAVMPPEDFIRALHAACRPLREICVGHEWCFGKNRAGNLALLGVLGDELGFDEVGVKAVRVGEQVVSSTLIREAVQGGDFQKARTLLGRNYTILGTVVEGAHLGSKLGFPTANLAAHNEQFPPNGVYAVTARLGDIWHPAVANLGVRPTVENAGNRLLEIHLLDFTADIYGHDMEVRFTRLLRPEQKFENLTVLREQIAKDVAAARGS